MKMNSGTIKAAFDSETAFDVALIRAAGQPEAPAMQLALVFVPKFLPLLSGAAEWRGWPESALHD
jgi:hypothetical protein